MNLKPERLPPLSLITLYKAANFLDERLGSSRLGARRAIPDPAHLEPDVQKVAADEGQAEVHRDAPHGLQTQLAVVLPLGGQAVPLVAVPLARAHLLKRRQRAFRTIRSRRNREGDGRRRLQKEGDLPAEAETSHT